MNKCVGCGVSTENNLCERCFRIRNYNEYKKIEVDDKKFLNNLDKIHDDDLVVLVVDLLNIPENLDAIKNKINNKVILVINKFDLSPTNNEERYKKYFDRYDLNVIDTICISTKNNYNLDYLYDLIKKSSSNKVYFIGYTNSGKSSLINKLIYNYSSNDTVITTSYLANTTLDLINIKLDDFTLIDTPGIVVHNSINKINDNILKKLSKSKRIKPISYQVKNSQYIFIEDLVKITLSNNDIIIYVPSNIEVNRFYKDKYFNGVKKIDYNITSTTDIVIPNIGFIKVKSGLVKIEVNSDIDIFTREPLI